MKIAVCLLVSMFAMAVHSLPTNRANRYYFLVITSFVQNREFFPVHDSKISTAVLVLLYMATVTCHYCLTTSSNYRVKRGFRNGAADRFSHGFGKRGELLEDSVNSIENSE